MEVKVLGILKKTEAMVDVAKSIVFDEGNSCKFALMDEEIKEGDELKALETLLKYCGALKEETAKIENRYGQRVRIIAPRVLMDISIANRIHLQVDTNAGVKGLSVPSVYEKDGCTLKRWRDYKHEIHNALQAFVDVCQIITVSNINKRVEEADVDAEKAEEAKAKAKA